MNSCCVNESDDENETFSANVEDEIISVDIEDETFSVDIEDEIISADVEVDIISAYVDDETISADVEKETSMTTPTSTLRLNNKEVKQLVKKNGKSWVWNFYLVYANLEKKDPRNDVAFCTLCENNISYGADHSTSKLSSHLVSKHETQVKEYRQEEDERAFKKRKRESDIRSHLKVVNRNDITEEFLQWIVYSCQPFDTCNDPYFRKMMKKANPSLQPMDRKSIPQKLAKKSSEIKVTLMNLLVENYYSLTSDHWTSIKNENFMATTCHWISTDWELYSVTLSCEIHKGSQAAPDIVTALDAARASYKLDANKLIATVTDTAPNMNAAGRMLDKPHHYCVDHVLELTTKIAFGLTDPDNNLVMKDTMKAARSLVGHIKGSPQQTTILKSLQVNNSRPLTVVVDVATRWWSTFNMCDRLVLLKPFFALMETLHGLKCNLTAVQWDIIEQLTTILQPFMIAQQMLECEKYVSISIIPFLIAEIRRSLEVVVNENQVHASCVTVAKQMLKDFNDRWGSGMVGTVWTENSTRTKGNRQKGIPQLTLMAAALDPRFKSLVGIPTLEHGRIWTAIEEECMKMHEDGISDVEQVVVTEKPAAVTEVKGPFARLVESNTAFYNNDNRNTTTERVSLNAVNAELSSYKKEIPLNIRKDMSKTDSPYNNPLVWWKAHEMTYPLLATLARRILCVPATSAPSERVFSTAGCVVNKKRASLDSWNVANCVFLHDTWPVIDAIQKKSKMSQDIATT